MRDFRLSLWLGLSVLLSGTFVTETAGAKKAQVVVIGVDGVSLNLLEPLAARGVTPNLDRLMREGARGDLASIWPLRTPQVWTTVATGKYPGQHGIWDHIADSYFNPPEYREEKRRRVTTADRRSQALWGLLGARGIETLSVGWVASWPAEKAPDTRMVAPIRLENDPRQTTIKGSLWRDAPKQVAPEKLWPRVKANIVEPADISAAELKRFADIPPKGHPIYGLPSMERYVYGLSWSLARAKSVEAVGLDLLQARMPDLFMTYFQCPDSLLHRFWIFHKSPERIAQRLKTHGLPQEHADELHRRFGGVVDACYRDVDARIGRLLERVRGPETLVLVVSDHGFGDSPIPHRMKGEPYSGDHRDLGVVVAAGPGVKPGTRLEGMSVLDVTPTILARFGVPPAADMPGQVRDELLPQGTKAMTRVPTYESKAQTEIPYREGWPVRQRASAER